MNNGITGIVTYSGTTATFTPSGNLAGSTNYTATITTAAQDTLGTPLASNYTWTFTTGTAPDITPPTVVSTSPASSATSVAVNAAISATFSEALGTSSVTPSTFTLSTGSSAVAGAVSYSGSTATFTPTPASTLAYATTYTATVTNGVKDLAGNAMAANYTWTFTTPLNLWAWMGGTNTVNQSGIYGTKGVAATGNIPGARTDGITWVDVNGNFWLFGGFGYDATGTSGYLNDLWKFDGSNWTWVSGSNVVTKNGIYGSKGVAAASNVPGSRSNAVTWVDGSGNLWLFGGVGNDSLGFTEMLNDLWKFDGNNWTWVSGSNLVKQSGVYGTQGVAAAGNIPGARTYAVSWIDGNGKLWLFSGVGYDSAGVLLALNDLWKFDGSNWTWMGGSNLNNQNGTYGTKGVASILNIPGAREIALHWSDANGNQWIFGGQSFSKSSGTGSLNDLWKFDGSNWTWVSGSSVVNQSGVYGSKGVAAAGNVPGSRSQAVSWIDSTGNLWLSSGAGYSSTTQGSLNDVWKFDGSNWTWVSGSDGVNQNGVYGSKGIAAAGNIFGSRWSSVSWVDGSGNRWLFGGYGYDSAGAYGRLNDMWRSQP